MADRFRRRRGLHIDGAFELGAVLESHARRDDIPLDPSRSSDDNLLISVEVAANLPFVHRGDESRHFLQCFPDVGDAGGFERNLVGQLRTQRHVQRRPVLCDIDRITRKH